MPNQALKDQINEMKCRLFRTKFMLDHLVKGRLCVKHAKCALKTCQVSFFLFMIWPLLVETNHRIPSFPRLLTSIQIHMSRQCTPTRSSLYRAYEAEHIDSIM